MSLIVMPFLSTESRRTLICGALPTAVLLGLVLNSLLGWAWADSVAALVIAVFAVREGVEAWKGDACATSVGMILEGEEHHQHDHDHDDHQHS